MTSLRKGKGKRTWDDEVKEQREEEENRKLARNEDYEDDLIDSQRWLDGDLRIDKLENAMLALAQARSAERERASGGESSKASGQEPRKLPVIPEVEDKPAPPPVPAGLLTPQKPFPPPPGGLLPERRPQSPAESIADDSDGGDDDMTSQRLGSIAAETQRTSDELSGKISDVLTQLKTMNNRLSLLEATVTDLSKAQPHSPSIIPAAEILQLGEDMSRGKKEMASLRADLTACITDMHATIESRVQAYVSATLSSSSGSGTIVAPPAPVSATLPGIPVTSATVSPQAAPAPTTAKLTKRRKVVT
ncbi:MAG: hypothetical protein [Trichoderma harzianum mononegavirus 1]|nr:MAG: hypothetical protein [Trichoderma harzianum mononegavirus 1]